MIRKFAPEDTEEIIKLFIDTYAEEPWEENWSYASAYQRILDLTISPLAVCYVICNENETVVGGLFGR